MIRAIAADGQIRAFAATTKDLVEEARRRHDTSPVITAALGRLLTAGVMMGSMMKGEKDTITLKVEGDGPVKALTVTADTKGNVKGFAYVPQVILHANEKGKLDVAGAVGIGVLTVIKDLGLKEPYVGTSMPVSYTHLDVYKRQDPAIMMIWSSEALTLTAAVALVPRELTK